MVLSYHLTDYVKPKNVTITAQITESLVKEKIDKTANPAVISSMKLFSDT